MLPVLQEWPPRNPPFLGVKRWSERIFLPPADKSIDKWPRKFLTSQTTGPPSTAQCVVCVCVCVCVCARTRCLPNLLLHSCKCVCVCVCVHTLTWLIYWAEFYRTEDIPWLLHEVLIKDTASVIKTTQSFMHFLTSYIQEELNLAICACLLICAKIYCLCYPFYHQHLYYDNALVDVRRSITRPCWFEALHSGSILCL